MKATLERKDLLICLQFGVQSIMAEKIKVVGACST